MGRPEEAAAAAAAGGCQQQDGGGGRLRLQLAAALAASLACAGNSYALAWGVVANWQLRVTDTDTGELQLPDEQRAWLNSALFLGTAVGCLLGGRAAAQFGARRAMLYSLLPLALGHALVGLASSVPVLLAGRLVVGVSSGIPSGVYVLYISGTSSPRYRGALTILADVICLLVIIGVIALGERLDWRWLAAVCAAASALPAAGMLLLLPDDPVWLLGCGRLGDAKRAAAAFDLDLELSDSSALDAEQTSAGWRHTMSCFTERKNLLPLAIVLTLILFNSFSGYMAILSNSLEFFRLAGFQLDAAVCSILFCAIRVLAVLLTSTVVDRLGRRVLLVFSCGGVSACYLGLVGYYALPAVQHLAALPVVLMLAAGFIYSSAMACIPFCLAGEMFPLRMRQLDGAIVTFSYNIFNVLAGLAFPRMLAAFGAGGLFLAHSVIMLAACVFTVVAVPETKGLSLAAIETLFDRQAVTSADEDRKTSWSGGQGV